MEFVQANAGARGYPLKPTPNTNIYRGCVLTLSLPQRYILYFKLLSYLRMINPSHWYLNLHRPEKIDLNEGLKSLPSPIRRPAKRAAAYAAVVAGNVGAVGEVGVHEVDIGDALHEIPALDATDSKSDEELPVANDDAEEKG